ncbi:MAG TPA: alginate export family protein, partial [Burkholderiales bacterium]
MSAMRNFMACTRIALVSACLLALASVHAAEDASEPAVTESADTPLQAISQGRLLLQLRPRYAYVDQSNKADAAEAWTMRSLLGWQTRAWADTSAQVQVLNVGHLGPEHYVTGSAPSPYPQVKDPDNTDINRLYVDYAGIPGTTIRVGRQDLILDNERMVGAKNFSQTSQVFDAATFRNQSFPGTTIFVGQFWRERTTSATDLGS